MDWPFTFQSAAVYSQGQQPGWSLWPPGSYSRGNTERNSPSDDSVTCHNVLCQLYKAHHCLHHCTPLHNPQQRCHTDGTLPSLVPMASHAGSPLPHCVNLLQEGKDEKGILFLLEMGKVMFLPRHQILYELNWSIINGRYYASCAYRPDAAVSLVNTLPPSSGEFWNTVDGYCHSEQHLPIDLHSERWNTAAPGESNTKAKHWCSSVYVYINVRVREHVCGCPGVGARAWFS